MSKQDIAVLDLGSNSFHMVVAQLEQNRNIRIIDKIKLDVRLAEGLDEHRNLKFETMDRALRFLDQLRERLEDFNIRRNPALAGIDHQNCKICFLDCHLGLQSHLL